jgi:hypothetical protein
MVNEKFEWLIIIMKNDNKKLNKKNSTTTTTKLGRSIKIKSKFIFVGTTFINIWLINIIMTNYENDFLKVNEIIFKKTGQ